MNDVLQVEEGRPVAELKPPAVEDPSAPLLSREFVDDLRSRWDRVQTTFVDEPRGAVHQADELVKTAIERLATSFTEARDKLESQWARGNDVNTEDLRLALRQYREFFHRLLAV